METPCQSSPRDAQHKNNSSWLRHAHTSAHTHIHMRCNCEAGVEQVSQLSVCVCVSVCEQGTRPRSEPLSGRGIICLGFYESCQQCYYSILNFDVLLGLAAPPPSCLHTVLWPASLRCSTKGYGSKYRKRGGLQHMQPVI